VFTEAHQPEEITDSTFTLTQGAREEAGFYFSDLQ
jgi:hypothetical protein